VHPPRSLLLPRSSARCPDLAAPRAGPRTADAAERLRARRVHRSCCARASRLGVRPPGGLAPKGEPLGASAGGRAAEGARTVAACGRPQPHSPTHVCMYQHRCCRLRDVLTQARGHGAGLVNEAKMTCAYRCISPECYEEVYAKDEVSSVPSSPRSACLPCLHSARAAWMRARLRSAPVGRSFCGRCGRQTQRVSSFR